MRQLLATGLAGVALLLATASAQVDRSFPMYVTAMDSAVQTVTVSPDSEAIRDLMSLEQVMLRDVYLPGGELVDLELEKLSIERRKYGFFVDGVPRPDLLDGLDLSIWRGIVSGQSESSVLLSFSSKGSRGWIQRSHSIVHLMPQPNEDGSWVDSYSLWISEQALGELGSRLEAFCEYEKLAGIRGEHTRRPTAPVEDAAGQGFGSQAFGSCTFRECTIALETDWQLNQVFGNDLGAETAYVTTLSTAGSDRYEEQINTIFTFPYVMFYTTSNDPWSSPDSGGSSIDMLYEFQAAWVGNIPEDARLAQMWSGANLGGGVAWLDVLCNNQYNFSVCGNINGNVPFPIQVSPLNWDFMVYTHELGHNFDALHTHDYCPPVDQCAPNGYFGQCQTGQVCTNQGTIMSYCHLCSGGTSNVTTFFHPTVINDMTSSAEACLPLYASISADPPALFSAGTPTEITAEVFGGIVGDVELFYRYIGGSYSSIVMTNTAGDTYSADLPAAACSDSPEFYIGFTSSGCGPMTAPPGGALSPFTAVVGESTVVFVDDFEVDLGWSSQNNGASAGDWERGVPVDDAGSANDPTTDGDGSGSCYLTMNQIGNSDVDDGSVTLFSPVLDMSGPNVRISYEYFLNLSSADGSDILVVEISENGAAGPWTWIAFHTSNEGLAWRSHLINMSTVLVTLGSNMMVRFTINDGDPQSIVEAGVDGFTISTVNCVDGGGPTAYCEPANGNSFSASGAVLEHVSGDPGGMMTFSVSDIPVSPGLLFFGPGQGDTPLGCGRLCITGTLQRSPVYFPVGNSFQPTWDTTGIATTPFNIQYWFRDTANQASCGDVYNLSNALGF